MGKDKIVNAGGINGLGAGLVNSNSQEFKVLQQKIKEDAQRQSDRQRIENELLSIRFQMESYLLRKDREIIEVGWFLKELVRALGIKNKSFAQYIDYKESNLSALYKGTRKINVDLSLKFGRIFNMHPTLWINIQGLNELKRISQENEQAYQKYSMDDLLKKAS